MKKNTANVPKLRFPGFTDDWEQRKLGEIADIVGGGTPSTNNPEYWDGDIDWYAPAEMEGQRYATGSIRKISELGLKKSSAQMLPAGKTVLFTSRAGIGKMAILQRSAATNQGFQSIVLKDGYNPYFIYSMGSKIKEMAEGVASGSTFLEISGKMLGNIVVVVPSEPEQDKIASCFQRLDNLITLHQRKLAHLQAKKKGLLQKMFPQQGECFPELRFPGFTDAWEQRKLGDFGKATGGTSIESEFTEGGKYKVISIGSYSEMSNYMDQGIRVDKTNKTESRILNKDDLTMILNDKTASGNIIGRVLLIDADNTYIYNQRTERIEVNKNEYEPRFLYQLLNADNIRSKIIRASQGNTQIYVNWSAISELRYAVPLSKSEQKQIGAFFHNFDNLITLHQRKLTHLQKQKKALLQQMFV